MCTVTYIPVEKDDFILTSNRDETPLRKTLPPETFREDGIRITYPKDKLAGGTWIGVSERQRVICLLNGGFVKHERRKNYRMSRGIIVKTLLTCNDVLAEIHDFNFIDIEPFTLISVDWSKGRIAHELVWDGAEKHVKELSNTPFIWSSSHLYSEEMQKERHAWFYDLIASNPKMSQKDIIDFHQSEKKEDRKNSIRMKRLFVETVSTTSIHKFGNTIDLKYFDYLNAANTGQKKLEIPEALQ